MSVSTAAGAGREHRARALGATERGVGFDKALQNRIIRAGAAYFVLNDINFSYASRSEERKHDNKNASECLFVPKTLFKYYTVL